VPKTVWLPSGNRQAKGIFLFRFAISNAFRRKGIAIFAILGTALGIALMTVLLSISTGMNQQMDAMMDELAAGIAVYPKADPMGFMVPSSIGMPIYYADAIETIAHVDRVNPGVHYFIPTEDYDFGDPMGVIMNGVDLESQTEEDDPTQPDNIIEGRTITTASENEVIIGILAHEAARGGEYADVGGQMVLPVRAGPGASQGENTITVTVVGICDTGSSFYDWYIYTNTDTAKRLKPTIGEDQVNLISVRAESTEYVGYIADEIETLFENGEVPVDTVIAKEMMESFSEMMGTMDSFLWIVSLVAAIAGGVSIFIVMLISVIERTKEFGILKASGWSNRNIITSVVVQSVTIGLLGAIIGLAIGYGAGKGIDSYINMEIAIITWVLALWICAFGILVGVVGGLYPAVRAARVSPIESLRAL
jgi:putative ABC transport system permease protein